MKTYVTFGQVHTHSVNGKTLDKNCVAVIQSNSPKDGRRLAFEYFGDKFCFEYPEKEWNEDNMKFYPRGYIKVN